MIMKVLITKLNKLKYFAFYSFLTSINIFAQTQVFTDNFSSGTSNWVLTGSWGLTTSNYYSASNSLTESPGGNYSNIQSQTPQPQ